MGMAYIGTVCNRCNADIPADKVRGNENWCSPECEPVQMRELRAELTRLRAIEAERNNLLYRVKALTDAQDGIRARCTAAIDYAREMDAELTRLRGALTVIAHGENTPLPAEAAQDYARIAREALEEKT